MSGKSRRGQGTYESSLSVLVRTTPGTGGSCKGEAGATGKGLGGGVMLSDSIAACNGRTGPASVEECCAHSYMKQTGVSQGWEVAWCAEWSRYGKLSV